MVDGALPESTMSIKVIVRSDITKAAWNACMKRALMCVKKKNGRTSQSTFNFQRGMIIVSKIIVVLEREIWTRGDG